MSAIHRGFVVIGDYKKQELFQYIPTVDDMKSGPATAEEIAEAKETRQCPRCGSFVDMCDEGGCCSKGDFTF
jgi:hypothetical protein